MAVIKKEVRDKIVAQSLKEIAFARRHKQGKIAKWQSIEDFYYGNKKKTDEARANVDLGQMQEHVHTLLSKIDNPLTFVYTKRKESQLKRVARLNAIKDAESDRDFWDIKDIAGKKQMAIYGRAVFFFSGDSSNGFRTNLENVDVYDFLIDPSAGGLDMERARNLGRYGVIKDRYELKNDKRYIQTEVKTMLDGKGNNTERPQEELNKQNRVFANKHQSGQKEDQSEDKFKFWEWCTSFEGQRYYLLISESGQAIRMELLKDIFASDMWPGWSYAAYPDLTEFWTPSPSEYVLDIIKSQNVSINQMLDNAERVNRPQRIVDVGAIKNLAELKYKRDGYIKATPGTAASAIKIIETPSINTPLEVFRQLEAIKGKASGVTDAASGVEDTDGRATIYEGNQANTADRFGLFNKSYSAGYKRFGQLFMHAVDEHLTKKMAVEYIGPSGIETERVNRADIFKKDDDFGMLIESSNAELALSESKKRTLSAFYSAVLGRPDIANQKVVMENLGKVAGASPEQIRQLLDLDLYGTSEIMSEAERDIEDILEGKMVKPNRMANAAYKQRFVNFMMDNEEDMDQEQLGRMIQYVRSLDEIIVSNTIREANEKAQQQVMAQSGATGAGANPPQLRAPGPAQPLQDVIQQNVTR